MKEKPLTLSVPKPPENIPASNQRMGRMPPPTPERFVHPRRKKAYARPGATMEKLVNGEKHSAT